MVAAYKCFEMICHPPSLFPYKMFILLVDKMYIISNPDFTGDDLFAMFHWCFLLFLWTGLCYNAPRGHSTGDL